jgi:trk system potassium uptake protein TrkH
MVAIGIGTVLLLLPMSTVSGQISLIDAFFTATSAVCVTGLIVQDTAAYFSAFGKGIIMVLFQLGGLGIMTFSTLILLVAGKRISIQDRIIIQDTFHHGFPRDVKSLIKKIFLYALSIELVGSLVLFFHWQSEFSLTKAVWLSGFHSVSAFCNAGFSLFSNSFEAYQNDTIINTTLMLLIIIGGIGFLVLLEAKELLSAIFQKRRIQVSLHTKLVLSVTLVMVLFGIVAFLVMEGNHSLDGLSFKDKILASSFQVVTSRTAGFNTMSLNSLSYGTIFLIITFMFVGASPGSTGGGVKTSTLGVIFAFLKSRLAARESVHVFRRTLPFELITKAYTVVTLSIIVISISSFILFLSQPEISMKNAFFEVFSAFGTVGLSLGSTAGLNTAGKVVIILTMYVGRIGPLALLLAFSRRKSYGRYEYVEESVMIG